MTVHHPGDFSADFANELTALFTWRRDVRHFLTTPLPPGLIEELFAVTQYSPSVGYSQPWRFLCVETASRREAVIASMERANAEARASYSGSDAELYAKLKLAGLREAPVHLAVFCDLQTPTGKRLGARTMPETLCYSTAMAVYTFWLAARARGVGVGWVSILDPQEVTTVLDVPASWKLVAYLCVGYPITPSETPELRTTGWEHPDPNAAKLEHR